MIEYLVATLHAMRQTKDMCDVVIISKNNVSHEAHSVVLAAASPVFKVMVNEGFKEYLSKVDAS